MGHFQWGLGPRRRAAASAAGLPQGPVARLMLIVARGCVKQCSCRFTPFPASAVPKAVVRAAQSHLIRASRSDRRFHAQTTAPSALGARLLIDALKELPARVCKPARCCARSVARQPLNRIQKKEPWRGAGGRGTEERVWRECGGSAICAHGMAKHTCKECGGSGACPAREAVERL